MDKEQFEKELPSAAKLYDAAIFLGMDETGFWECCYGQVSNLIELVAATMVTNENFRRTVVNALMEFIATDVENGPQVKGVLRVMLDIADATDPKTNKNK